MSAPDKWERGAAGAQTLVIGALRLIVRADHSWTLIANGEHVAERKANNRYSAKRAVIRAAQEVVAQWSIALDVHSAELEPRV